MAVLEAEQKAVVEAVERLRAAEALPALELRLVSLLAAQRELLEHLASQHAPGRSRAGLAPAATGRALLASLQLGRTH